MNTLSAFMMGEANRGRTMRVFDWDKALKILHERELKHAFAGLSGDLEYTIGGILKDHKLIIDDDTYLASTWAIPVIVFVDEIGATVEIECWCWDTTEGNPHGYTAHSHWGKRHFDEWQKINGEQGE